MKYPIVIHKDVGSGYGVTVPDLPGCFSGGATLDEAIAGTREAVSLHLRGMLADGEAIPEPSALDAVVSDPNYAGGVWFLVDVDPSAVAKAERVNITLPRPMLEAIDRFAAETGETRSGLLVKAASRYMQTGRPTDAAAAPADPRRRPTRKAKSS